MIFNFFIRRQTKHVFVLIAFGLLPFVKSNALPNTARQAVPDTTIPTSVIIHNTPKPILKDARVRVEYEKEQLVIDDGLQPSMIITRKGTVVVQSSMRHQVIFPSKRMVSAFPRGTVVSRDGAKTWKTIPLKPGENGLFMESDPIQLKDGTIIAIDTYVTPGTIANQGLGQLYTSNDEWQTLNGPEEITFNMPGVSFGASSDDGGHPHDAARLHRTILELPNGDLLATIYGWWQGDTTAASYQTTMKKTRSVLLRSTNKGRHWEQVSTIAVDPQVGTEGFDEPTLVRLSKGPNVGRLICFMRTGQELYETTSDDEGRTWTKAKPRIFAGLDIRRTDLWIDMFRKIRDKNGKPLAEDPYQLVGAVVDPRLLELRSGVLVAAFGVRVPPRANWRDPSHPWNGNYLAFSLDHGKSWSHVERLTSGVLTTHYMAIQEMPKNNQIFVAYDHGDFSVNRVHYTYGRLVQVTIDQKMTQSNVMNNRREATTSNPVERK
ncbi:MAG: sialidase family protein [Chitinophagaceae bacterium]